MLARARQSINYRDLLYNLVVRDLKVRYKHSFLGFFWSLLNPLLLMLITPGYWFQHLTVKQPDDSMIEVAIVSLKEALAIREPVLAAESPAAVEAVPAAAVTA